MEQYPDYQKEKLLTMPIPKLMLGLLIPGTIGNLLIYLYVFVDIYFVSFLGTDAIVAMSFISSVALIFLNFSFGLGVGVTAVVSHALGAKNELLARRLSTDSFLISFPLISFACFIGWFTIEPLFTFIGVSSPIILKLTVDFMKVYYIAIPLIIISSIGNSILRANGDAMTVMHNLLLTYCLNLFLNPCLIFGLGPFPELGLKGSAIASTISAGVSAFYITYIICIRDQYWSLINYSIHRFKQSFNLIFKLAIPSIVINVLGSINIVILMYIAAQFGESVVGAFGVTYRIFLLVTAVSTSLCTTILGVVGQNWSSRNLVRIKEGMMYGFKILFTWGICSIFLLLVAAQYLPAFFTKDSKVAADITLFVEMISISGFFQWICDLVCFFFIGIKKLNVSLCISFIRFIFFIPIFAYFGGAFGGAQGVVLGISLGYIIFGIIIYIYWRIYFESKFVSKR